MKELKGLGKFYSRRHCLKTNKGGFGLKPTGITRRTFKPNLQKVNAVVEDENGNKHAKKIKVSTRARG